MNAGRRLPSTPEPMHTWTGAGGIKLAGDSWGNPDSPLVLLQHGGGQTRHAWGGTGELLGAAGYYAVAYDACGHGDSEWAADGQYDQDVMVRDLACIVAALGGRPAVLVGAPLGGATSLVAVGESHVEVRALILVDIVPATEHQGVAKMKSFMEHKPEGFDSLDEVVEAINSYRPQHRRQRRLDGSTARRLDGSTAWQRMSGLGRTENTTGTGIRVS